MITSHELRVFTLRSFGLVCLVWNSSVAMGIQFYLFVDCRGNFVTKSECSIENWNSFVGECLFKELNGFH